MEASMLSSYRKNDPVIYICQNNDDRTLEISALSEAAEEMTGYRSQELVKKSFSSILPERIGSVLEDIVEYETGAPDVADALLKCRDFGIRNNKGETVPCRMRVVRCAPVDKHDWFQVVLVGEEAVRRNADFQKVLHENFKGHETLDTHTGLPDRASLLKDIQLTIHHAGKSNLQSSFAVIVIDKFRQIQQDYGADVAFGLYRHVADICRRTLRADDTLGMLNDHMLGCILMDTNRESARMACNRLRWTIAASPMVLPSGQQLQATVSFIYTEITGQSSEGALLADCESKADALPADPLATNGLHFVPQQNLRKGEDRRKVNVAVEYNRRMADRRKNS
jgi:diguanylate cyclase (GGDEF)-like protein